jgi:hypothetical protein
MRSLNKKLAEAFEERKKTGLEKIEQETIHKPETIVKKIQLDEQDFPYAPYSGNEEVDKFLHSKKIELRQIIVGSSIECGRIFTEIQDKLEGTGISFNKWLRDNEISKTTAFRQKRRYELFQFLPEEYKKYAVTMSEKEISLLNDKEQFLENLKAGKDYRLAIEHREEKIEIEVLDTLSLDKLIDDVANDILNKLTAHTNINETKKEKVFHLLEKIQKLLED